MYGLPWLPTCSGESGETPGSMGKGKKGVDMDGRGIADIQICWSGKEPELDARAMLSSCTGTGLPLVDAEMFLTICR